MCADTHAGRVYYRLVTIVALKGEVFLSKWRMGGRFILFDPLPHVVIFKSLVINCQGCILLGKWFQTYIHVFFFFQ